MVNNEIICTGNINVCCTMRFKFVMGSLTFKSIQLQKKGQADLYGNEIHRKKNPHFSFCWNATFSDLSVIEMCWMAGTFQWQFSRLSLPIQSPFNHQSVILLLRNKNLNYLSLNYAEKNSQTEFKHTVIIIFAVLKLLVIVCWGD